MNKEEINFNLNTSVIVKAAGIGACVWPMLHNTPFLFVHPNAQNFCLLLLPTFFLFDFYKRLKDQKLKNNEIIKDYKIKNYKTPIPSSFVSGLIGSGTLTFLYSSMITQNKIDIFLTLFSVAFLVPEIISLRKIITHNKKQIDNQR